MYQTRRFLFVPMPLHGLPAARFAHQLGTLCSDWYFFFVMLGADFAASGIASCQIYLSSDKFQVLRVRAVFDVAQMVDFSVLRNLADKVFVGEAVRACLTLAAIMLSARVRSKLTVAERVNATNPLPTRSAVIKLSFADVDFCPEPGNCCRVVLRHLSLLERLICLESGRCANTSSTRWQYIIKPTQTRLILRNPA